MDKTKLTPFDGQLDKPAAQTETLKPFEGTLDGEEPKRGFGGWARDIGATAVKGAIAVPEMVVGLADIPTGGRVGKFLENEGGAVGFRPKQAKEIVNEWHSDATKEAQRKFQEADGFWDKAATAVQNPSLIATAVGESIPSMLAGGVMGRGALAAARGLGFAATPAATAAGAALATKQATIAGAAGEGLSMAGSAAEQIRQETEDGLLTPMQSGAALLTGAVGGAISRLSGGLQNKLGIGDADTMAVQGLGRAASPGAAAVNPLVQQTAARSIPNQVVLGAINEGLLEELPQSLAEQMLQNVALGKPWHQDLDAAAIMGTLSGGVMGAGAAGFNAYRNSGAPEAVDPGSLSPKNVADYTNLIDTGIKPELQQQYRELLATAQDESLHPRARADAAQALHSTFAPEALPKKPATEALRAEYEARLADLQAQEQGEAPVRQSVPPDGRAVIEARRNAEMAAGRANLGPDDEIYQSTGATDPVRQMVKQAADAGGALSSAAVVAIDTGAAGQMQQAADQAQAQAVAQEQAKAGKKADPAAKVDASTGEIAGGAMASWSDDQLSSAFRGAQDRKVRIQIANELQRRRTEREQADLQAELQAEQASLDLPDAPDSAFASVSEDAGDFTADPVFDGMATIPTATKGRTNGPQAAQAQQAGTQPAQPADSQAAGPTVSRSAGQGEAIGQPVRQPGALTNAAPTSNNGAQAAPAPGTQAQAGGKTAAPAGAAVEALRTQLREVEDKILRAAPGAMAAGGGDIEAAMKSRKVPVTLKARRKKLQEQLRAAPAAGGMSNDATKFRRDVLEMITRDDGAEVTAEGEAILKQIPRELQAAALEYHSIQKGMEQAREVLDDDQLSDAERDASARLQKLAPKIQELHAAIDALPGKAGSIAKFGPETGTLGIPRSEMPQVPAQSHGGLVKHLNAQGIAHETTTVDAAQLKPTQAEYIPEKVEAAKSAQGDRAVIVSKDGHIIDGHHQAMAAAEDGKTVKVIVLDAPVDQALEAVKNSPSASNAATAEAAPATAEAKSATTGAPSSAKDAIAAKFKQETGVEIGVAGTMLAGIEVRNNMRKNGSPAGTPATLEMEAEPFTKEQMRLLQRWEVMRHPSSKFLFHTTTADRLQSIAEKGLTPGAPQRNEGVSSKDAVSFAANEETAAYYGKQGDVMLRVSKKHAFKDLAPDVLAGEGAYVSSETVPPDALEAKVGGKWVPIAEAVKSLAPESKAAKKPRGVLAKLKQQARAKHFTPGNVVGSYAGHDRVVSYQPGDEQGNWSVTVRAVQKQGDTWVDVPNERDRQHRTEPDARELTRGPVGKVAQAAQQDPGAKRGAITGVRNVIEAIRQRAMKAAAERENRRASREIERGLFAELTAANAGMVGKSQEQIMEALRERLAARDAATALNYIQVGRLARAILKHVQANAPKIKAEAGRDAMAKHEAILEGLGAAFGEEGPEPIQQANFLLGFEHALSGKTKSTLAGDGLAEMLKGYEHGRAWVSTDAGAKWYEGKGRKKLENTGTDLRRHWEAMKAQMKADESDIQKAWKQIERATNRADLFAAYLPEDAAPGWVKYVTDLRGEVMPFKQWLTEHWDRWYGSSGWGRSAQTKNLEFILSGQRYPRQATNDGDTRDEWAGNESVRIKALQGAAGEYLDYVRTLTAPLDGAKSVSEAANRFVDMLFREDHRADARTTEKFMYGGYQIEADLGEVARKSDLMKFRVGSDYTQHLIERETTLALPSKATPLTPPKLDRITREGAKDWRNGKDVTPEEFKKAFGFADVGFGNWVGARNDQDHLNYAYDAYMDMAAHLGIEPSMVGLGGKLHFTIGALGHGKHAAHFSPNHPGPNGPVNVINLTNTRGDGTVYHEYGHALDHNLGGDWQKVRRQIINVLSHKVWDRAEWERKAADFLEGRSYWRGDKRADKVDSAVRAMGYYLSPSRRPETAYKVNADQLGKDYWGNEFELFARAIEAWAVDTMGHGNTYLVQPEWAADGAVTPAKGYRGTPYPTGDERKLFNDVLSAFAKSIKSEGGQLVVSAEVFERNLPEALTAGLVAQRQLSTREGMLQFQRDLQERREAEAHAKDAKAKAAARAEQEEQDRLAAAALATLAPATVDPTPAAQTAGHLSDDDLSAIFDEAAAELREGAQEQPDAPAPGEPAQKVEDDGLSSVIDTLKAEIAQWLQRRDLPVNARQAEVIDEEIKKLQDQLDSYERAQEPKTPAAADMDIPAPGNDHEAWWKSLTNFGRVELQRRAGVRQNGSVLWNYVKGPDRAKLIAAAGGQVEQGAQAAPRAGAETSQAAEDKTAAKLVAEAAKLGVKGVDEAMAGLSKLFGGGRGRLNSFPAGFDEDTYNQAKPHFKAALTAFQEAGKTLKDLFKLLIQQFGDGVKPYAIQFAKDEGLGAQLAQAPAAGETQTPSGKVANFVQAKLAKGEAFTWQALFDEADRAFGGTQAEGKYTPKDAYDAMEAGMNRHILANPGAFNPNTPPDLAASVTQRLHELTQLLPTQSKRTAEQDEFQQFSTVPALAYAANWVANVTGADTMLEPSAGIGGLAVFAKNAGARLVLNELSARRAGVLREVFQSAKVYQENAEHINNILPDSEAPSVVVMNPPFSATAGRVQGRRDTSVGALHVEQALKRMSDGGRLVAIVGEGMNFDRPAFRDWWQKIQKEYDVRAAIPMDGSGYAKYGTTFNNAILVIDKVKPSGRAVVTTPAKTYPELINLLAEIRNDRPDANLPASTADEIERFGAEQALGQALATGTNQPGAGFADADTSAAVGDGNTDGRSSVDAGGAAGNAVGGSERPRGNGAKPGRGGRDAGTNAARGGDTATANSGGSAADNGPGLTVTAKAGEDAAPAELSDSVFESYRPQRLDVPGAKPHPGPLVQSSAMAAVVPPAATYTPNLPAETIKDGLLSLAQIEAVVYAGQAHSEFLEDVPTEAGPIKFRRGFFIGDGTGVGKGREISGILLDNWRQGRTKAVWISEKQGLMNDAKRDFKGVGGDDSVIFNQNKTKAEDAIQGDAGIIFTTYSTLRSGAQAVNTGKPLTKAQFEKAFPKGSMVKVTNGRGSFPLDRYDAKDKKVWINNNGRVQYIPDTMVEDIDGIAEWKQGRPDPKGKKTGQSRLDQLVNWLGEDYDGVIAFDEAHNAGNAVSIKGERGASEPSAQALAVVELQRRLPKARVVYVSATGATQVSNLSYATRLGLWGPGTPFASVQNFIAEMVAGGLSAMELVARDIKQMGAYLARSLSYEGVTYSRLEHELTPIQRDIYNRLAEAWQVTLRHMDKALEVTGAVGENGNGNSKAKMAAKAAYWGAQQRFFNQIITSMQMPTVLAQIEADVAAGEAVVLQLVNTNEAQQTRALAKRKEEDESADLEELDLTPRDMLIQMVEKSFPVVQHEERTDENDKIVRVPVMDADGNPVLNREAVKMRDQLLDDLKNITVPDGPLEMLLNQFGPDRVAEVTGRTQRVVRKDDGTGNVRAQLETRGASAARADADAFMADRKPILIFSDAGGTGFSFHADNTKANKRKRKHYLVQPGWRADKAVQGFGRTHRTNQASAPHYYLASTDVPAQKRFLSAIARRLDQLGALTKGQRDTANQGMFSERDNLESKYASEAVRQFFEDGMRQTLEGINFQDFLHQTGLEDIIDNETNQLSESKMPETRLFLNRMLSLTLDMQNKVFDAFLARMDEKVSVAQKRGEFDSGMQTLRALETRVVSDDVAYTDERTGAETRLVELELTHATIFYDFPEAMTKGESVSYVVNEKSGRVYVRQATGKTTLDNGAVVDRFRLSGTSGIQYKDATEFTARAGVEPYREVTKKEARDLWKAENAKRPQTYKQTMHMVVGAMLPIWDRLKVSGRIQVARTQTVDGRRLLGMMVPSKNLADLRKRLNVSNPASKLAPQQVMARILKGEVGELANGWKMERVRVSNDLRIELKAGYVTAATGRELTGMGMMMERISWADRYFVPTGAAGLPVLERLLSNRPLVELVQPVQAQEDGDVKFSQGLLSQPSNAPQPSFEAVQRFVDKFQKVAKEVLPITVVRHPGKVPGIKAPVGTKPTGAVVDGHIYLFADNMMSPGDVMVTVFHELFHLGLQKVIPAEDYAALLRSFANNALVQKFVRQWKASPEGVQRAAKMPSAAYESLAAEEALAMVSEELFANGGVGTAPRPALVKRMLSWLAEVADKIGLPGNFGEWIRGLTRTDAERFAGEMVRAMMGGQKNLARTRAKYGTVVADLTNQDRLRLDATEQELADLFKALEAPRGLKLTQAHRAIDQHPMSAKIREVESNFLDILERLDEAGLVQINC